MTLMHHALEVLAAGSEAVLFGKAEHGFNSCMTPGSHFVTGGLVLGLGREILGEQLGETTVKGKAAGLGLAASSSGMVTVCLLPLLKAPCQGLRYWVTGRLKVNTEPWSG